jgi:hypothetical protein
MPSAVLCGRLCLCHCPENTPLWQRGVRGDLGNIMFSCSFVSQ